MLFPREELLGRPCDRATIDSDPSTGRAQPIPRVGPGIREPGDVVPRQACLSSPLVANRIGFRRTSFEGSGVQAGGDEGVVVLALADRAGRALVSRTTAGAACAGITTTGAAYAGITATGAPRAWIAPGSTRARDLPTCTSRMGTAGPVPDLGRNGAELP